MGRRNEIIKAVLNRFSYVFFLNLSLLLPALTRIVYIINNIELIISEKNKGRSSHNFFLYFNTNRSYLD